ncbi:MlaC/ttg2D family ABC transporter substrate-binding protein [Derxia gummosa]|uniref:MlaC/ttg2D family ABC transporter substrate-binding protein n=1 Tax=Derxia gummosa DSM 723 TaxID=1121388 RepID=A0A8B6XAC0_9BURK|nr:ABC transporter substrate-binding protein [Derxia gummosa]
MQRRDFIQHTAALAAALSLGLPAARAADATGAPDALIRQLSTEVLGALQSDKAYQSGDIGKIMQLVDRSVMPYVDFERTTGLAVGRAWRQATPEQKKALSENFKQLLVRTYAGALSQVKDVKFNFLPFRADPDQPNKAIVKTQVIQAKGGDPIQLDYALERKDGAAWKIYDLNVLGVWLVENYRNTFAQEVNKSGIDGLIKSLESKNAELSGGKA